MSPLNMSPLAVPVPPPAMVVLHLAGPTHHMLTSSGSALAPRTQIIWGLTVSMPRPLPLQHPLQHFSVESPRQCSLANPLLIGAWQARASSSAGCSSRRAPPGTLMTTLTAVQRWATKLTAALRSIVIVRRPCSASYTRHLYTSRCHSGCVPPAARLLLDSPRHPQVAQRPQVLASAD